MSWILINYIEMYLMIDTIYNIGLHSLFVRKTIKIYGNLFTEKKRKKEKINESYLMRKLVIYPVIRKIN